MRDMAELTPERLMTRARAATGLGDFGPDHFVEPLDVLTRAMREEADLHEAGTRSLRRRWRTAPSSSHACLASTG